MIGCGAVALGRLPAGPATGSRPIRVEVALVHDTVSLAGDADLAHLVDLLDILPHPQNESFWKVDGVDVGSKIGSRLKAILSGTGYPTDVDYLAVYVLKYLGHGNRHITEEQMTRSLRGVHGI